MKDIVVRWWVCSVIALSGAAASAAALVAQTPTRILVRVTAKDAKIIGSGVGGARIRVSDAETGQVLAEGIQEGSTGSTDLIMSPHVRGETVFDTDGAAGYVAEVDVTRPTRVLITAEGPLDTEQAIQTASKSLLVIPGRDVMGEGVILELNGFTVEVQSPEFDAAVAAGEAFEVRARVTMLCGCPTEPGGLWDSSDYEILVRAVRDAEVVGEWPMAYAGTTSEYTTEVTLDAPGEVDLQVLVADTGKGNFGLATRRVTVR